MDVKISNVEKSKKPCRISFDLLAGSISGLLIAGCGGGGTTSVNNSAASQKSGIISNDHSFAAILSDGTVVAWGNGANGGNLAGRDFNGASNTAKVTNILATHAEGGGAYTALLDDGTAVSWGNAAYGGDSTGVDFDGINGNLTVGTDII